MHGGKSMTEEKYNELLKQSEEWYKRADDIYDRMQKEEEVYEAEMQPIREAEKREKEAEERALREVKMQRETNLPHEQRFYGWGDHPSTMENGTATILWIAAIIVSLLGGTPGIVLCVLETVAWWKFVTRHDK
jgi:membrane-associated HD superfamily phosphohydrolase